MEKKRNILNIIIYIIAGCAGIITLGLIIVLCKEYSIFNGQLKIQDTGNVGDFFGGVVGSLIGLISVLLLYKTLRYQQKDIESNELSSKLQWSSDLLIKILDDLKNKKSYEVFLRLKRNLGSSDIYYKFLKDNLEEIQKSSAEMNLEFRVINKLIYQENFDIAQINLLRLITYNTLGDDFFRFINLLNDAVADKNIRKSSKEDFASLIAFETITKYLNRILVNVGYKNDKEIESIINNYRAEDNLSSIRLEDWLEITGITKKG